MSEPTVPNSRGYPDYSVRGFHFRYPRIFWEGDAAEYRNLAPHEFKRRLEQLRQSNAPRDRMKLREIVRKCIERLSVYETMLFLTREEVRDFLLNERLWGTMSERRKILWRKAAGLPETFSPTFVLKEAGERRKNV